RQADDVERRGTGGGVAFDAHDVGVDAGDRGGVRKGEHTFHSPRGRERLEADVDFVQHMMIHRPDAGGSRRCGERKRWGRTRRLRVAGLESLDALHEEGRR
ncbi:MAG: hypothetical protein JWO85_2200, partial [Candidatus Eremiobacteraeota bacterium]|nr:hypothetical protein [Candidatus Eremiobacteraeota bacterium]